MSPWCQGQGTQLLVGTCSWVQVPEDMAGGRGRPVAFGSA